eukprot:TRINITY_DN34322_c0_g1_i1.p1 TRINITY_DN34322_c0_g1~~TRINITY_DN34322_c0_g1_i1.p1  ORF type:complete len:654 (-),score=67.27 TRINITY_DN34322_c0_g1_i1:355-2244(-)
MDVVVRGLTVTAKGTNGKLKPLLDSVSFKVETGDVVALMGPSGAGKTTMLNRLVGRGITGQVSGHISCGGRPIEEMRTWIGYVTQDDIMYEQLTPRENMMFAAAFVNANLSSEEKTHLVTDVLKRLRLEKSANTVVGTPGLVKGISGGERKRTNVALSLLCGPKVLLLDEPTTGLDSRMAEELMTDVSTIAKRGCTVIATIHQPSEAAFERFTKVLLLESGHVAFFGCLEGLRDKILSFGFRVDGCMPLPEMLLEILVLPLGPLEREYHTSRLLNFQACSLTRENTGQGMVEDGAEIPATNRHALSGRLGWFGQLKVLLRRDILVVRRTRSLTVVRFMQTFLSSVFVGWIFAQLGNDLASLSNRVSAIFVIVFLQFMFPLLGVANAFCSERVVFLREAQDRWYHPTAFYFSKVCVDTVMQFIFPIVPFVICYPLIGLNVETALQPLSFFIIIVLIGNFGAGAGFTISAGVSSVSTSLSILPGFMMPQLLLCGLFIRPQNLPQPFQTGSYVMALKYALQAAVTNEFTCDNSDKCEMSWRVGLGKACSDSPCNFCCTDVDLAKTAGICPVLTCTDAQRFLNLDIKDMWPSGSTHQSTVTLNILVLCVLVVAFRLFGLMMLMLSYRRSVSRG